MIIKQITDVIERFAPLEWQESYDNAGLIVGRPDDEVHKALLAVDVTEEVLDEAEAEGCDLVITHHPIVFRALKRFNSADPVERCVERAIRSRIALYACHTNLEVPSSNRRYDVCETTDSTKNTGDHDADITPLVHIDAHRISRLWVLTTGSQPQSPFSTEQKHMAADQNDDTDDQENVNGHRT